MTWTQSTVPSDFPQPLQTWTHEMAMSDKKLPRRRAKGDDRIRLMVPHSVRREQGGEDRRVGSLPQ